MMTRSLEAHDITPHLGGVTDRLRSAAGTLNALSAVLGPQAPDHAYLQSPPLQQEHDSIGCREPLPGITVQKEVGKGEPWMRRSPTNYQDQFGPEAQQQQARQESTPVDTSTYPLALKRMRRRFEETALSAPEVEEVILTHTKQSVQCLPFPAPDRHHSPTPRPDTQA